MTVYLDPRVKTSARPLDSGRFQRPALDGLEARQSTAPVLMHDLQLDFDGSLLGFDRQRLHAFDESDRVDGRIPLAALHPINGGREEFVGFDAPLFSVGLNSGGESTPPGSVGVGCGHWPEEVDQVWWLFDDGGGAERLSAGRNLLGELVPEREEVGVVGEPVVAPVSGVFERCLFVVEFSDASPVVASGVGEESGAGVAFKVGAPGGEASEFGFGIVGGFSVELGLEIGEPGGDDGEGL